MKLIIPILHALFAVLLLSDYAGQETIPRQVTAPAAGSVTFTAGQLVFNVISGTTVMWYRVSQPYEISVVTAIKIQRILPWMHCISKSYRGINQLVINRSKWIMRFRLMILTESSQDKKLKKWIQKYQWSASPLQSISWGHKGKWKLKHLNNQKIENYEKSFTLLILTALTVMSCTATSKNELPVCVRIQAANWL